MKKISVILPTYNRVEFLQNRIIEFFECLKNYPNLELMIVDDASTDQTKELVDYYTNKTKTIKYIRLKENSGSVSIPRAIGIVNTDSEYVAHQDDDCVSFPFKYNTLSKLLDEDIEERYTLAYGAWVNQAHPRFIKNYNAEGPGVDNSQILYRRNIFTKINVPICFPKRQCDWELMKKIQEKKANSFIGIDELVSHYIWHKDNRSLDENTKIKQIYPEKYKEYFNEDKYIIDFEMNLI